MMFLAKRYETETGREVQPGSFIFEFPNALSEQACADMVNQFEAHPEEQNDGVVGSGLKWPELKRSTDLYIQQQEHWKWADELLFNSLHKAMREITDKFPLIKEDPLQDVGYQLQRTLPGEYYHWHKDLNKHSRRRVLVAIWYLNTVARRAGGCTEFKHQGVKVRPEAGKLILFPPYWTHIHRGQVLKFGTKYLATTWITYKNAYDEHMTYDEDQFPTNDNGVPEYHGDVPLPD